MSWSRLLFFSAVADAALLLGIGAVLGDKEALAFAAAMLATTAWLIYRRSLVAIGARALVFLDVEAFMAPGVVSNIAQREPLGAILAPLLLSLTSAIGIVATAGYLSSGRRALRGELRPVATALVAVVAIGAGMISAAASGSDPGAAQGDLSLTTKNARYSTTSLSATAGSIVLEVANDDLFWHTVTFDDLSAEVRIPVKAHRRLILRLNRGTYKFHCAIPGHAAIGMRGTLTAT